MLGGISGVSSYSTYYMNMTPYRNVNRTQGTAPQVQQQAENAQRTGGTASGWALRKPSNLGTPVQPVDPVKGVNPDGQPAGINLPLSIREGADPAEMAVRMRIQPYEDDAPMKLPKLPEDGDSMGAEAVQDALKDGECETCEKRKYQDGSDDMSVSFQTPTNIKPEQVASAVRGHEMEHVVHEQAKARKEDRKVVSQSVTLHTDICPECGKTYVSGGETRTVTKANPETEQNPKNSERPKATEKAFSVFG